MVDKDDNADDNDDKDDADNDADDEQVPADGEEQEAQGGQGEGPQLSQLNKVILIRINDLYIQQELFTSLCPIIYICI